MNTKIGSHIDKHGDGIKDVAFTVNDAEEAWKLSHPGAHESKILASMQGSILAGGGRRRTHSAHMPAAPVWPTPRAHPHAGKTYAVRVRACAPLTPILYRSVFHASV